MIQNNKIKSSKIKYKCKDCNHYYTISELANVNTPRCTSCHIQLILNITLGSCSIM